MPRNLPIIFFSMIMASSLIADQQVIENPKPTFIEKKYSELKKFKEIGSGLGKEYLFNVFSLTMDREGRIYAYDNYQGKIFKFDQNFKFIKSFGKVGMNRGEFAGTWKAHPVEIKIGGDGFLYANDSRVKKILKFSGEGKFIDEYPYDRKNSLFTPFVDVDGTLYFPEFEGNGIIFKNQSGKAIIQIPASPDAFKYLLFKPDSRFAEFLPSWEMEQNSNEKMFLYLCGSSTMIVTQKGKKIKEYRIVPQEALDNYKMKVKKTVEESKMRYISFFSSYMCKDYDDPEAVFLQIGANEIKKYVCSLYQFNSNGQLLRTYIVKMDGPVYYPRFYFKSNNIFYSLVDGKIYLYKEER
jgi:hypothetical protein